VAMVAAAVRASIVDETELSQWAALEKRLENLRKIRNKLVHFKTIRDASKPKRELYVLVPTTPDKYMASMRGKGTRWHWQNIHEFNDKFMELGHHLSQFGKKILQQH
jgi:hypothetical protein